MSPADTAKQVARTIGFVSASYALGAILFVGYVATAVAIESHKRGIPIK